MNTLEIYKHVLLDVEDVNTYTCVMYHQCYFYFCDPVHHQIDQFDLHYKKKQSYKVERAYTGICFDDITKKYYAICRFEDDVIYVLDEDFKEIDCIQICFHEHVELLAISCECGLFYLTTKNAIYTIQIDNTKIPTLYLKSEDSLVSGIHTKNNFVTLSRNCYCCMVKVYNLCLEIEISCCLEKGCRCISITYDSKYLYILCRKGCEVYIIICVIKTDKQEDCEEQSYCDVIESIALSEAALAHILNAEGEKLQKVIASTCCIDKILETNEAVNEMVVSITHLEKVLYDKLRMVALMKRGKKTVEKKE